MDKFLKRNGASCSKEVDQAASKKPKIASPKGVSASVKTVKKWMKELNIDLDFDATDDLVTQITCKTCKLFAPPNMSSNFITGNSTVKRESVNFHVKSSMHDRAVSAKAAHDRKLKNEPSDIEKGFQKMDLSTSLKMTKLFRTAYYIAQSERPFSDFPALVELQDMNGLSLGDTYHTEKAARNFVEHIGGVYFDNVKGLMHNADYFSIFCDGSTDRSDTEKEVIFVKCLEDYYPKMKYFKIVEPENTKAEGILAAIDQSFFEFDLANYKQKTVGFCSDGASVMMGAKKGVIQLMKTNGNADWIKAVWCLAHRLELAVKDAFKSTYMDRVIEMLISIYYFYKGSAKRFKEAEDIAELLGEHFLKPEKANGTRWVDHKLRATAKLIENWPIIVTQMENYAEDKSNKAEDRAKVRGYLTQLKQHKMVLYMGFVKDVLNEVAKISLLFQREDITVYSAVTKLQSAQTSLRGLIDNDGPSVTEIKAQIREGKFHDFQLLNLLPDDTLANDRRRITQSVLDCMSSRLENLTTDDIFLACNAFDHKNWPHATERDALLQYGTGDVRVVFRHYQTILTNAGCN